MSKMVKEQEQGNLIVLSGPSGAGKDSIINELKNYYHNFWVSISMTSRKPRGEEVDGIDYFFVSKEEFEKHLAEYIGNTKLTEVSREDFHDNTEENRKKYFK